MERGFQCFRERERESQGEKREEGRQMRDT